MMENSTPISPSLSSLLSELITPTGSTSSTNSDTLTPQEAQTPQASCSTGSSSSISHSQDCDGIPEDYSLKRDLTTATARTHWCLTVPTRITERTQMLRIIAQIPNLRYALVSETHSDCTTQRYPHYHMLLTLDKARSISAFTGPLRAIMAEGDVWYKPLKQYQGSMTEALRRYMNYMKMKGPNWTEMGEKGRSILSAERKVPQLKKSNSSVILELVKSGH